MDLLTLFIIVFTINAVFYFFDVIFKSCSHYPYVQFLKKSGLSIGLFKITWFTTVFNSTLFQFSTCQSRFLPKWFTLGVIVTLLLVPVSVVLLIMSISNNLLEGKTKNNENSIVLEPMVPGVNLPVSDIGYYLVTIAVCSIIHEVGHAIAAYREGIHVFGIGLFIIFIVPVAYVKVNSEELCNLHPLRKLRIFCAGIWHNVILSLLAYIFLISLPFLLSPLYDLGSGVHVLHVTENSKIGGASGIVPGDKLVAINDCEVSDTESWQQCLISFTNKPSPGYCVSEDIIHELDESVPMKVSEEGTVECCENSSGAHLCFETMEDGAPLQILQYSCLPGRPIIAGTPFMCQSPNECPPGLHCVRPVTPEGTTLLRIQRFRGNVVIYIGVPKHILLTVTVSDYSQIFDSFPSKYPEVLIRLSKYFILFSSGLAVMNAIPCFYFDGYHISNSLINYLCRGSFYFKYSLALSCNFFGTLLLALSFSCALWKLFSNSF